MARTSPYILFLQSISTKGMTKQERSRAYQQWKINNIPQPINYKNKYEECQEDMDVLEKKYKKDVNLLEDQKELLLKKNRRQVIKSIQLLKDLY